MSELRKANTDEMYFVTFTVAGWIDIFNREIYIEELIKNLQYCQREKELEIFSYVIMPSHIHMVVRRENGRLNELIRDFKSYTAKRILKLIEDNPQESRKEWLLYLFSYFAKRYRQNEKYRLWQKTNYPIELDSPEILEQKIDYIHNNPVKAGIVNEPENYIYSSANPFSELKISDV
jgi:putative transposase